MISHRLERRTAAVIGLAALCSLWTPPLHAQAQAKPGNDASMERGKYLATAADCVSCHSAPGGQPFAGGYPLKSPFGIIYGPNITSDTSTGIGTWTEADFEGALRRGVAKDGTYIYPAMPYNSYTKLSDADIDALWTYIHSLAPVKHQIPKNTVPFPLNVRTGIRLWQGLYFKPARFQMASGKDMQWNRGAYLVQALGHCEECHTPRNVAQGLESRHELTGAQIEGWYAPNISDDPASKVRQWTAAQYATFLKSGVMPNNSKVVGPMQEVVQDSLSHLTSPDIQAMVVYLKDQPGEAVPQRATAVKFERLTAGKQVYDDNCSSCHRADGKGRDASVPGLAANDAVTATEPYNVIMAILEGFPPQGTWGAMGSFAAILNDDQIADVANYVRTAWNNAAPPNATPWSVGSWRKKADVGNNESHALLCPSIDTPKIKPALALGPSALKEAAGDNRKMSQLVARYRSQSPHATRADVVEALGTAYCRAIADDPISTDRMSTKLSDFAQRTAVALQRPASTG